MDLNGIRYENNEVRPEAVHTFYTPANQLLGRLVIDSRLNGISGGGIRIGPDISTYELSHLARTMTLKYAFLQLPFGGAKAAVIYSEEQSDAARTARIRQFGRSITPFKDGYLPGKDIGIDDRDHGLILQTTGVRNPAIKADSAFYTALTVRICAQAAAQARRLNLSGCRVAIEGFGKVGGWVARQFDKSGCKIVAVSNIRGALYSPGGLDINELIRLRAAHGNECLNRYAPGSLLDRAELFALPADLLLPCAASWSIHTNNLADIKAKMIVCGANNPVTDRAKERMKAHTIDYFPDFVSNCGGVLGSMLESLLLNRTATISRVENILRSRLKQLIRTAEHQNQSLESAAVQIARENFDRMKHREASFFNRTLFQTALRLFRRGVFPKAAAKMLGPAYLKWLAR